MILAKILFCMTLIATITTSDNNNLPQKNFFFEKKSCKVLSPLYLTAQ